MPRRSLNYHVWTVPGAPYIVSLVKYTGANDAYSSCTLLNHLPHNARHLSVRSDTRAGPNNCSSTGISDDALKDDLTGGCQTDYYVTVTIPAIKCTNCAIVLLNPAGVRTAPNNTCGFHFAPGEATGETPVANVPACSATQPVYASCAKIEIRPFQSAPDTALTEATCVSSGWPFSPEAGFPQHIYTLEDHSYTPQGWLMDTAFHTGHGIQYITPDDSLEEPDTRVPAFPWAREHKCASGLLHYTATMTTDKENFVQDPVSGNLLTQTYPIGSAAVTILSPTQAHFSLTIDGLSSPVNGVHLHGRGCEDTPVAPVVVDLTHHFTAPTLSATPLQSSNPGSVTGSLVTFELPNLRKASYKIVVDGSEPLAAHLSGPAAYDTPGLGGTETRFECSGAQEVPLVLAAARATATVKVTSPTAVQYRVTLLDMVNVTGAHFHHAPRGENGPVLQTIIADGQERTWTLPADQAVNILAWLRLGHIYVNVHTTLNPGGEVRGQVEFVSHSLQFVRSGKQWVADGAWHTLAPAEVKALRAGLVHVQIITASGAHLTKHLDFARDLVNLVPLEGQQEVPPVPTKARGSATLQLTGHTLRYSLAVRNMAATAAHFHGPVPRGANGPVAHAIALQDNAATGTWELTDSELLDLRLGRFYVNVHSADFPNGELRGQTELHTSEQHLPPHAEAVVTLDAATIDLLKNEFLYVNVHTLKYPSGEVRGQLRRGMGAKLDGRHEIPAVPTNAGATFSMKFLDARGHLDWTLTSARLPTPVGAVHFHGPASPGELAPPFMPFLGNFLQVLFGDCAF